MNKTKKQIAILVEEQYQVLEVWYPVLRLAEAGIKVKVLGTGSREIYPSKEGYPIHADDAVQNVRAEDFAGVVIPGGWAPDFLRRYEPVVNFVRQLYHNKAVVAAICHGGWLLVSADIARGNKVTCFSGIKDDLIAAGGIYSDQEVVVDKNLVTARKPSDLPRFVREIIRLL
jgi:protease I